MDKNSTQMYELLIELIDKTSDNQIDDLTNNINETLAFFDEQHANVSKSVVNIDGTNTQLVIVVCTDLLMIATILVDTIKLFEFIKVCHVFSKDHMED